MNIKEAFAKLLGNDAEDGDALKTIAEGVMEHIGLDQYKTVLQRADEVIKALIERVDTLEAVVTKLAEDDVERIKQFAQDGDWTKDLFSASTSGEEAGEDEAAKAKKDMEGRQQDSPLGMEAFFGGGGK